MKHAKRALVGFLAACAIACHHSPTAPGSDATVSTPKAPTTITRATPLSPGNGILVDSGNVSLVFQNAVADGDSPIVVRIEISCGDAAFSHPHLVDVVQSSGASTTYADTAGSGSTYCYSWPQPATAYWRVTAHAGELVAATSGALMYSLPPSSPGGALLTPANAYAAPPALLAPSQDSLQMHIVRFTVRPGAHSGDEGSLAVDLALSTDSAGTQPAGSCHTTTPAYSCALDLPPGTYFWRARAGAYWFDLAHFQNGITYSDWSPTRSFTVAPQVMQAPTPISPLRSSPTHAQPTFIAQNAVRTGPIGSLTYTFTIDANGTVATATVPEGVGTTQWTAPFPLTADVGYSWSVYATDTGSGVTSPVSSEPFSVQEQRVSLFSVQLQSFCSGQGAAASFFATSTGVGAPHFTLDSTAVFDMTNANGQLAGTITGSINFGTSPPFTATFSSGVIRGVLSADGSMAGTFDATVQLEADSNGWGSCRAAGVGWSAMPLRQ